MEEPPGRVGPLPKMKTSSFLLPLFSRGPLGPRLGPLEPRMGPMGLEIVTCRPDMGLPKHVNCLFSLNFDSERSQYLMVRIENGPLGLERGVKFHPFHPPGCATAGKSIQIENESGKA